MNGNTNGPSGEELLPRFLESKPVKKTGPENPGTGKKILLGVLLLILTVMIAQTFFAKKPRKINVPPKNPAVPALAVSTDPFSEGPEPEETLPETRVSPFSIEPQTVEVSGTPAPARGPVLQGILTDGHGESMAVIDEKIVKKGGRIADNLIKEISSDSVLLQKDNGEEWMLRMKS